MSPKGNWKVIERPPKGHKKTTKRPPKGHQKATKRSPKMPQKDPQKVTKRSPKGHPKVTQRSQKFCRKVTKGSPKGHQKVTKRSLKVHRKVTERSPIPQFPNLPINYSIEYYKSLGGINQPTNELTDGQGDRQTKVSHQATKQTRTVISRQSPQFLGLCKTDGFLSHWGQFKNDNYNYIVFTVKCIFLGSEILNLGLAAGWHTVVGYHHFFLAVGRAF